MIVICDLRRAQVQKRLEVFPREHICVESDAGSRL